jgi:hypothetical protein
MTTLNNTILSVTRRTTKGFTVGEIYDRVVERYLLPKTGTLAPTSTPPPYNSVRARVYELARSGSLKTTGVRKDPVSDRTAKTFARS